MERIPSYLAQEMHSLDPRLFVDFNNTLGLWEVRLFLKESECNLEGVPWLEAWSVSSVPSFGNVVELRPTSICVKRVQTLAGNYRPFDLDVINYLRKIDVHRWGRLKDWLDFVDNIGKGEIESKRALSSEGRVKQIKADWHSAHVERRFIDYGHNVCV